MQAASRWGEVMGGGQYVGEMLLYMQGKAMSLYQSNLDKQWEKGGGSGLPHEHEEHDAGSHESPSAGRGQHTKHGEHCRATQARQPHTMLSNTPST